MDPDSQIICCDCIEAMRQLPAQSVDPICAAPLPGARLRGSASRGGRAARRRQRSGASSLPHLMIMCT